MPDPIDAVRRLVRAFPGGRAFDAFLRDAYWNRLGRPVMQAYFAAEPVPKLQIGCGSNILPGWLNSDYAPRRKDVLRIDATKRFPFADGQFQYVFSEHMIEHIEYPKGVGMLKECHRILRRGGRIRIATPDLKFLLNLHLDEKNEVNQNYIKWSHERFVKDGPIASAMVINNFFRDWGHQFIYDQIVLSDAMREAGFEDIAEFAIGDSHDDALRWLEYEARLPEGFLRLESLTLEARKP